MSFLRVTVLGAVVATVLVGSRIHSPDPHFARESNSTNRLPGVAAGALLLQPDTVFSLSKQLREISGLAMVSDTILLAIQDEQGTLFEISGNTGKILSRSRFWRNGDFEAVAVTGDQVWVAQSNGDLFVRPLDRAGRARRIRTRLRSKDDIEGIEWSSRDQRLVIAAKERMTEDRERVIYAFDVKTEAIEKDEWARVSLDSVSAALGITRKAASNFKPSDISIHPITGELFVVSSSLQAVAILDSARQFVSAFRLDPDILPQPEGIAFNSTGDMFIASEGKVRGVLAFFRRPSTP